MGDVETKIPLEVYERISVWTQFHDMHSGGGRKLAYDNIYIELPQDAAVNYFEMKFGRHPSRVTCDCCGSDFSYYEHEGNLGGELPHQQGSLVIPLEEIPTLFRLKHTNL